MFYIEVFVCFIFFYGAFLTGKAFGKSYKEAEIEGLENPIPLKLEKEIFTPEIIDADYREINQRSSKIYNGKQLESISHHKMLL